MLIDLTRLARWFRTRKHARAQARESNERDEDNHSTDITVGTTENQAPVLWPTPSATRASHMLVLAGSGAGKSVLTTHGLLQEIARAQSDPPHHRPAYLVVDPKGDLAHLLLYGLLHTNSELSRQVYYLDPFSGGFPFNLNQLALGRTPIDIRASQIASLVGEVSTSTGAKNLGMGVRQVDALTHLILGALSVPHPKANLLLAYDALTSQDVLAKLAIVTTSQAAKQFLESTVLSADLLASCASRLRSVLNATERLGHMVSTDSCVQFNDLLAPGTISIVDLGEPYGGMEVLTKFYANVLVRLAFDHLMERKSPWSGHHCRVVIDEAQIVAPALSDTAERVLCTGRSRGVSLITLSQSTIALNDASNTLMGIMLANNRVKFIGRLASSDSRLLASEQSPAKGTDESISVIRNRFQTEVTNLEDRQFFMLEPGKRTRFKTADVDLPAWLASEQTQASELTAIKDRLAVPVPTEPRLTLADLVPDQPKPERKRKAKPKPRSRPRAQPKPEASDRPEHPEPETIWVDQADDPVLPTKAPKSRWG